jgi:PAS domain S-box-containing protein
MSGTNGKLAPLAEQHQLVQSFSETSPAMLWIGDAQAKCVFLNRALRNFWGVDPEDLANFDWSSTLHPDDIELLAGPFGDAMGSHTPFSVQARYKRADGTYRMMRTDANPRFDDKGTFLGMSGVNTDVTDQLLAEEHTRQLMGELNHRTKNLISVVQALARQTARKSSPDEFLATLDARLRGLAASNDLLVKHDWGDVLMSDLVDGQFTHLSDLLGRRILVSGPPLWVSSRGAQTLGMALHELSTNSLKYGALSEAGGIVHLDWRKLSNSAGEIEWREELSSPIAVSSHKGFGHSVTVDMVAAAFSANVTLDLGEHGLVWRAVCREGLRAGDQ